MGLDIPALRILRETIRTYEDCRTYTDQGQATVFSYDANRSPQRDVLFATAFRRPNRLRFDVRCVASSREGDDGGGASVHDGGAATWPPAVRRDDAVVCWRGRRVQTWVAHEPTPVESLTLEAVLAEVSDLPTAAAGYVTHLLLRHRGDFAQEHRVRYQGLRSIEEGECHKVTIPADDGNAALTLWIDAASHLIRRLLEVHRPPAQSPQARPVQTILRFEPRLDESLRDELFAYEPPPDPHLRGGFNDLELL